MRVVTSLTADRRQGARLDAPPSRTRATGRRFTVALWRSLDAPVRTHDRPVMLPRRPTLWLAVSLFAALLGCSGKQDDPVQAICEALLRCDCPHPPYINVDHCILNLDARFDELAGTYKTIAEANGLTYDASCFERSVAALSDDLDCSSDRPGATDGCAEFCAPVHGDKVAGTPCTDFHFHRASECAGNLRCMDGVCVDTCTTRDPPGIGDSCLTMACADGLRCDNHETGTCKPALTAGESCPFGDGCADGLVCGIGLTCQLVPGEGDRCDVSCAAGLVCEMSTCKAGPGAGHHCVDYLCGPDLSCDLATNVCVAAAPFLCYLAFDL